MAIGVLAPIAFSDKNSVASFFTNQHHNPEATFQSSWHEWPDMNWAGPEYWGNRLQDWGILGGKVVCLVRGQNRTLHCLTSQLSERHEPFETSVSVEFQDKRKNNNSSGYSGFRLGAKSKDRFDDYRCAAVFGEGLDVGITMNGNLFIDKNESSQKVDITTGKRLVVKATPKGKSYQLQVFAINIADNKIVDDLIIEEIPADRLKGNIALVQHYNVEDKENIGFVDKASWSGVTQESLSGKGKSESPLVSFSNWIITGTKVSYDPGQVFGPVCFAQYTVQKNILKLTGQLAPVETIMGQKVELQIRPNNSWQTIKTTPVESAGRIVHFRIDNWMHRKNVPYRLKVILPLKNGIKEYFYQGTIAAEPINPKQLKAAIFSCNADFGFPDTEVVLNVQKHKPDMAVFLGDQIYESHGGFGFQTSPPHKATLDYLRKWYMFGWSYREIFRHIPCAIIPDDHDVYHGNVWGESGKHAPTNEGFSAVSQDQGGFKMPPVWVNMVQRTQTCHLPDPYDPTPVKEGIGVYYTSWNYGGVSFAILEDRKFKSAPKNVLPPEVKVINGFVQNPKEYDIKDYRDIEADLLGERQLKFLDSWSADWSNDIQMKTVFSQTNFCTIDTLPEGSLSDSQATKLLIPEPGGYVQGDAPVANMDSNGWPQRGRDEAIMQLRKCFAFHIAGDQHLASFVHYGIDSFGDAGYVFAGPALNNTHPRRWWPPVNTHKALPGQPLYTGNWFDGFGNRITVHAVANPAKTNRKPARIYDRSPGYGIVIFDKAERTIKTECWPRHIDPQKNPDGQYAGWPITITQEDNYGRRPEAWLPEVIVKDIEKPVIRVTDEKDGTVIYSLRLKSNRFKPKVFANGSYTISISDPDTSVIKEYKNVKALKKNNKKLLVLF